MRDVAGRPRAPDAGRHRAHQGRAQGAVALTLEPDDQALRERKARLEARIEHAVAEQMQLARAALGRGAYLEARRHFLMALALDPGHVPAFEGLRNEVKEVRFVTHIVRAGESLGSIAQRYYCLLYTSPSPRDRQKSRMPSSA